MTLDNIRSLDQLLAFVRESTEPERRALAPEAIRAHLEAEQAWLASLGTDGGRRFNHERLHILSLALYATANLGEIKKEKPGTTSHEELFAVLAARRPPWLADWAEWTLDSRPFLWPVVRRLVREGICPRPESDGYFIGIIPSLEGSVAKALLRDPDLLDDEVWKLFELEGRSDCGLAQHDKYASPAYQWGPALAQLAGQGRLDRDRLLTASLNALSRGFKQFAAGWFSRFHESLNPSVEERLARLDQYLHLLANPVPPTVSFALSALEAVDRSGKLPPARLLEAIESAVFAKQGGTASRALKLIARAVKQDPQLAPNAGPTVAAALEHAVPAVQKQALTLLDAIGQREPQQQAVHAAAPLMAPSVRAAAGLSAPVPDSSPIPPQPVTAHPFDPARRIVPIATIEDLIAAWLQILETESPPEQLERVLDGASRLCLRPLGEAGRLAKPLAKRARQIARKREWFWRPSRLFAALALAWLDGVDSEPWQEGAGAPAALFLVSRVREVAANIVAQRLLPCAAVPTHTGGWIEPGRSVDAAGPADAMQARLRAGRDESLIPEVRALLESRGTPSAYESLLPEVRALLSGTRTPSPEMTRWIATIAPAYRDLWFEAGAVAIKRNLDWSSAEWNSRVYLETLLEPGAPLGPHGARLLALGLAAKESGEGAVATSALIAAIREARLTPDELRHELAAMIRDPEIKLRRIVTRLYQASAESAAHAQAIHAALEGLELPKPFLQLFADLAASSRS